MKLGNALPWLSRSLLAPALSRMGWRRSAFVPLDEILATPQFGFDDEARIKPAAFRVRRNTMASFERLASLWNQVRYLDRYRIEGALVECGVWKGGASGMMALAHVASGRGPTRELHLFDSFQGLPEPRAEADGALASRYAEDRASGKLAPIGQCVGTLADNRKLLEEELKYPAGLLRYHEGWFERIVPRDAAAMGPIALLRLDGDWYESTRVCLKHLYPKVARGGVVVVDDYGHWEGCKKAVDEFLEALPEPALLSHIDYTARFWVKI